jgi:hypothetical protein
MRLFWIIMVGVLTVTSLGFADLEPGSKLPNPTLTDTEGKPVQLHELLSTVTVLHLWKCD